MVHNNINVTMAQHLRVFAFGLLVLCIGMCFSDARKAAWCTVGHASEICARFPKPIVGCTRELLPVCGIVGGSERQFSNRCRFCFDANNSHDNNARITKCGPCRSTRPHRP